jgi:hypothetical protein
VTRAQTLRLEVQLRTYRDTLDGLLAPVSKRSHLSVLADLMRRAEQTSEVDGYPRGGAGERVGGGDSSDPALGAVIARANDVCPQCTEGLYSLSDGRQVPCNACGGSGRRWADPVPGIVADILRLLGDIGRATKQIEVKRRALQPKKETSLQGDCLVCGRAVSGVGEDRLKRGCCPYHYGRWNEWKHTHPSCGDPIVDFQRFVEEQRSLVEA